MVSSTGRDLEPVAGEHALVVLDVVADLEHRGVGEHGPQALDHRRQVELAGAALAELVDMGRAAGRSPRRGSTARQTPTSLAREMSSEVVSVSIASSPRSTARARMASSSSSAVIAQLRRRSPLARCAGAAGLGRGRRPRRCARPATEAVGAAGTGSRRGGSNGLRRSSSRRERQRRVVVEADQAVGQARLARRCACSTSRRLGCLIWSRLASRPSSVPILGQQLGRVLGADPGHARDVVGGVADQRQRVADQLRADAEALDHLGAADRLLLHRVPHARPRRRPAASGPCRRRRR